MPSFVVSPKFSNRAIPALTFENLSELSKKRPKFLQNP